MKFKSEVQLEALNNATVDTDKFLVSDSSTIKYRTGAQVLSDIGGQAALTNPITGTGTLNYVSKFTSATTLGNSQIFDNGTNVGIGTTSPSAKLDIRAQGALSSDLTFVVKNSADTVKLIEANGAGGIDIRSTPGNRLTLSNTVETSFDITDTGGHSKRFFLRNSDKTLGIYNNDAGQQRTQLRLVTGAAASSDRLSLLEAGGNVGIGTTAPTALGTNITTLDIKGSIGGGVRSGVLGGSESTFYTIAAGGYLGTISNIPLNFQTNNSVKATILANGNVGIGTTSPATKLDVNGQIRATYSSAGVLTLDRTATNPSQILFTNSGVNSGFIGADSTNCFVSVNAAGTTRLVVNNSTGNVGIGTSTPPASLSVQQITANSEYARLGTSSSQDRWLSFSTFAVGGTNSVGHLINSLFSTGALAFGVNGEKMRITSGGNVGIGISNPVAKLDVFSSGTVQTAVLGRGLDGNFRLVTAQDVSTNADQSVIGLIGLDYITTPNAAVRFHRGGNTTGGFISFTTNDGSERMRITSAGAMGLGVTPTNTAGRFEASNDIVAYSSSDRRWKTNIKNIDSPLEKISQINGVEFDWIEDEPVHGNKGHDIGVIAQEIENILPDAVQTRESGMKAVKYEKVIPLLIEAIKEQQKQIEELKQIVNGLTN